MKIGELLRGGEKPYRAGVPTVGGVWVYRGGGLQRQSHKEPYVSQFLPKKYRPTDSVTVAASSETPYL